MRSVRHAMRKLGMRGISNGQIAVLPWQTRQWIRRDDAEPWAIVEYRLELRASDGTAWLRYDVDHFSCRTGPQGYPVQMVATPCRFGGQRWWWICPASGRRVSKLYLPNGGVRFLSRGPGAYRLAYASQSNSRVDRMHARARRLFKRLGADYRAPFEASWPAKPKGMRWRTYYAICGRLEVEEERMNVEFLQMAQRLIQMGPQVMETGPSRLGGDSVRL
jgi:hypothetical protein